MGSGIRVNAILPGIFDTPLFATSKPELRAALEAGAERVVVTSSSSAAAQDPACLTDTGSRIAGNSKCRGFGRSYSSTDIDRTGQTSAADALALLDPSITVHK